MIKEELLKELLNINIKNLSITAINKSRGTKIRTQIKELCIAHDFKLIDAVLNTSYLSIYIHTSKYYNRYLHFEFNLCDIENCLDNIKVSISEGFIKKINKPFICSWDDIESIMVYFSETCSLKYPKKVNKFNKKDIVLYKKGSYFYIGIIKNIIKNDNNTYSYELYNDKTSETITVNESNLYVIENSKSFAIFKKSDTPIIDESPCRQLACNILNRVYNSYEDYYTLEDWLVNYIEREYNGGN